MTDNKNTPADSNTQQSNDQLPETPMSQDKITTQSAKTSEANSKVKTKEEHTLKAQRNTQTTNSTSSNKLSKTAVLALVIAIASGAGVAAIHYLHSQQNSEQNKQLLAQVDSKAQQNIKQLQQLVNQQQALTQQQIQTALAELTESSQTRITQLEQQIARFEQNQPSDWLVHEAEYLTRIAARTLWLEHDTQAAIALLNDAEHRIKQLNDPQYLPIRQHIYQDIEALKLMPQLDTEEVLLQLMALSKQLPQLSFAMAKIPDSQEQQQDLQLSQDAADWRANLVKTWRKFLADFITVRRRTGQVEPLMAPEQQQHLKENLALKLQQLQWAASKENTPLYQQYMDEAQLWLREYFDLGHLETAKFYQSLQLLKDKIISYDYAIQLQSHQAIRQLLTQKSNSQITQPTIEPGQATDAESDKTNQEQTPKAAPEQPVKQQPVSNEEA
ncbi:hypothetical protein tinsulaeT_17690 [Thalassotalea insulae]|uniref:Heme biosynthesis operon protein HemX n=1 Tax=Thalassotalea insulae TaxID=2056778 RepID=A0ABQ6GTE6_9GAMM|nr:uroporphyrinogen-III C-methyltransferase [Thalassotalea insulae]GLX78429.1 hypothetical protein tinsulaeT_17690 [Thalassotalea insulae]